MTDGELETVVSASLQNIKSLKTQLNIFFNFCFIQSETSDSFVNHFDGHFAYLKTLDFYFNPFTAVLAARSLEKPPVEVPNLKPLRLFLLSS